MLADWLAEQGAQFDALYTSPQRRAVQTAEIINGVLGLDIVLDADLRETEVKYLHVLPRRPSPLAGVPDQPFEAEYEQMYSRVLRVIRRISAENARGRVLVVAHAGTLGTMIRTILGSHSLIVHTGLSSLTGLQWREGHWHLLYANQQEHLASSRLPSGTD
jgi:probable phosphoglycerate mutase